MSTSAPFEREQVDTVFEDRSGYLDLTTEGEDMINSSGIKDHTVVSHEEWLSARTAFLAKEKCKLQNSVSYFWYCSMSYFLNCSAWKSAIYDR